MHPLVIFPFVQEGSSAVQSRHVYWEKYRPNQAVHCECSLCDSHNYCYISYNSFISSSKSLLL